MTNASKHAVRLEWSNARRVAVKIGSALLTDGANGNAETGLARSHRRGCGGTPPRGPRRDPGFFRVQSRSAAARSGFRKGRSAWRRRKPPPRWGRSTLAHAYQAVFASRGLTAAQILVTPGDTEERRRYLNARNTVETLFKLGAIPVVNENDTVATTEIRYGDNDRLAARVATMVTADCLVLLSDIDGLYTAPPAQNPDAKRLDVVTAITPKIEAMAGDVGSELSRGGMVTKLAAAKIAVTAGTHMVIASGKELHPLKALSEGAPCTWFLAAANPVTARKRWIAGTLEPKGVVVIDDGARAALQLGRSLLPAGVKSVSGEFGRGEAVIIRDESGGEVGRGLIGYSAKETAQIAGRNSMEIVSVLGYAGRAALIHRDDMALLRDLG